MHDHYASTEVDPNCDLCMLAQAMRPIEVAAHERNLAAMVADGIIDEAGASRALAALMAEKEITR